MTREELLRIYNLSVAGEIQPDTYWAHGNSSYVFVCQGEKATLDGEFTVEELEFFIGLMK